MKTQLRSWLLPILLTFTSQVARADVAVVVGLDSPLQQLNIRDVSDMYLGRLKTVAGERLLILEHPRRSLLRERFHKRVNGMDLSRVDAYWARLQFSGENLPPPAVDGNQSVLDMVRRNRHAIGYVDASTIDKSVRTVLTIKE